jgi:tetratricopeptide (TPR) repeat protein
MRLGYVHYLQGRYEEALHEYEQELTFLSASDHALKQRTLIELHQKLGAAHLRLGHDEAAARAFARATADFEALEARGASDPATAYYIASLNALQGDTGKAFRYLAEVVKALPALNRVRARIDPDLASLRAQPEFDRVLGDSRSIG